MCTLIRSIEAEYRRYKALAGAAVEQVPDNVLTAPLPAGGNSLATICWRLSSNLESRFTNFLTSDGEKPWRQREEEFAKRVVSRPELLEKWGIGWEVLFATLRSLTDADIARSVVIRGRGLAVHHALHRSLAHASYHVGQLVYLARSIQGDRWKCLSIPPGGSAAYNANPTFESPSEHEAHLRAKPTA